MKIYHIIEPYVNSSFQSTLLMMIYLWRWRFSSSLRFPTGRWSLRSSVPLRKPWFAPGFHRDFFRVKEVEASNKGGLIWLNPLNTGICMDLSWFILRYPLKCVWKWGLLFFCSLMMVFIVFSIYHHHVAYVRCSGDFGGVSVWKCGLIKTDDGFIIFIPEIYLGCN